MTVRFTMPIAQWVNSLGVPLAGGKLYFYATGTSTPLATYSDSVLSVPNDNPVVADSTGVWDDIYLTAADYKVNLTTSAGVQIAGFPVDPVSGVIASTSSTFLASGTGAVSRTVSSKLGDVISAKDFGATGDGSTDDSVALQAWLTAIPTGGAGYLPPATVYYKVGTALTRSDRTTIYGVGLASRIHYTGSGVALTLSGPRFSRLENFWLTGTSSAVGGIYVKSAQEGYFDTSVFVENFSGSGAYARRFSSCWTGLIKGGSAKACTNGLIFDTTNDSVSGINNSFSIFNVDCSNSTTGIDYQKGFAVNIIGCDFSTTTTGIEIGRAIAGTDTIRNVNISGCYFESTNAIYIGRGNTSANITAYIEIKGNYINGSSNGIHIYVGDSVYVGEQSFGAGTNTIDAGVTGTLWMTQSNVTDNSTAGQTTYLRGSTGFMQLKQLVATSILDCPTYTVGTVPAATAHRIIYVSNESGGAVLAFSDGTNWRRVTDRAIVS